MTLAKVMIKAALDETVESSSGNGGKNYVTVHFTSNDIMAFNHLKGKYGVPTNFLFYTPYFWVTLYMKTITKLIFSTFFFFKVKNSEVQRHLIGSFHVEDLSRHPFLENIVCI